MPVRVGLGSTSELKSDAVGAAFASALGAETAVKGVPDCSSGVNEQPVGHAETLRGAQNRLKKVLDAGNADYAVGIENGIVEIEGQWYDVAWVVVEDVATKLQARAQSVAVEVCAEDVEAAKKEGFKTTTVGSRLAKRVKCDAADPHKWLTNDGLDRAATLQQATSAALGSVLRAAAAKEKEEKAKKEKEAATKEEEVKKEETKKEEAPKKEAPKSEAKAEPAGGWAPSKGAWEAQGAVTAVAKEEGWETAAAVVVEALMQHGDKAAIRDAMKNAMIALAKKGTKK